MPETPMWWSDALRDPWRDPASPMVVVTRTAAPEPPPAPPPPPVEAAVPRRGTRVTLLIAVVTGLLAGSVGGALGYLAANRNGGTTVTLGRPAGSPAPAVQRPPDSLSGVIARVMPSVVTVHAAGDTGESLGSGFVISTDGHILTNEHVLEDVRDDRVSVTFQDNTSERAKVIGRDPESDLAVLQVERDAVAAVELGDSDAIAVGDQVFAVGAPLALSGTVTTGIVSALDRPIETGQNGETRRYYAAIQTDAAVNQGNSGGPLFDAAGQVIGINSVIKSLGGTQEEAGNIGLAFAIPINQATRVAADIIDTGKARRTVIGAQLDTAYRSAGGGVRLQGVDQGGPAADAGLRTGDVIVKLSAHHLEGPADLIALVRRYDPGTVVTVVYQRGGSTRSAQVTLVADAN